MIDYEYHSVADLYPEMSRDNFETLKKDIECNGLIEAIWVHGNQIIDGRHRYKACTELGITPRFKNYQGDDSMPALITFVIGLNEHRRHLDSSQKSIIALEIEKLLFEDENKNKGGRPRSINNDNEKPVQIFEQVSNANKSSEQSAKMTGTNRQYVSDAKRIQREAPELIQDIKRGDIKIPTAKALISSPVPVRDFVKRHAIKNPDIIDAWNNAYKQNPRFVDDVDKSGGTDFDGNSVTPRKMDATLIRALSTEDEYERVKRQETYISEKRNKAHVSHNSGENEWYTPSLYIEKARAVMGCINTDPASSDVANTIVKADTYYTSGTNGLDKRWLGNVWMNPPYSSDLISKFCEKLINEFSCGNVHQAIVLVNNATETKWFQSLAKCASAICFPSGRIKYLNANGEVANSPLQGQAIMYFGSGGERLAFIERFSELGFVLNG